MPTVNLAKTSPLYLTRFIAAYMVLMYHYSNDSLREILPAIKRFGEPVNYFFFISGFVMIISSSKYLKFNVDTIGFSRMDFWLKRIARIYPMYILALLSFVLFNYTIKEIDASISKRVWLEIIGIQRWIYAGSVNFPGWTISCEFFFYFLFPFTLPLLVRSAFNKVAIIILILFFTNIIFTKYYYEAIPRLLLLNHSHIYSLILDSVLLHPIFKYIIFLFGCLCGRFYLESDKMTFVKRHNSIIFLFSLIIIISFYAYDITSSIVLDAGLLCLVYFPFVLSICNFHEKILQIFSWKPFILLGEISYGIYIIQAPVEHYFEYLFTNNKPFTTNIEFLSYTLFLIMICFVLYYLYEIPAKKIILRFFKRRSYKNPSAVVSV